MDDISQNRIWTTDVREVVTIASLLLVAGLGMLGVSVVLSVGVWKRNRGTGRDWRSWWGEGPAEWWALTGAVMMLLALMAENRGW